MDSTIETFDHAGLTVRIGWETDVSPFNPRQYDNLGTMVCAHRRYELGDEQITDERFRGWNHIYRYLRISRKAICVLPLGLYDHSGISMYVGAGPAMGDSAGWDSGQVGFIYTTKERLDELGCNPDDVEEALRAEVKEYSSYLCGEVYYYLIEDAEGDVLESCGGYIGDLEYVKSEAREAAETERKDLDNKARVEAEEAQRAANQDIATVS